MDKCRDFLKEMVDSGDVAIPKADKKLSSHRVLTMTFEEGLSLGEVNRVVFGESRVRKATTQAELVSAGTPSSLVGAMDTNPRSVGELPNKKLPKKLDFKPADVAYLVAKTFSEQM